VGGSRDTRLEHRIAPRKTGPHGNINYEPLNHENMVRIAPRKSPRSPGHSQRAARRRSRSDLLIVAWGSTAGSITAALKAQRAKGRKIGHLHLRHLNRCRRISRHFQALQKILVPELNMASSCGSAREVSGGPVGLNKIQGAV